MTEFLRHWKNGMLPRGALYSMFYPVLLHETKALFRLFWYAKDFETFYKTALWARAHINEGMFYTAFAQAVIRRPDTKYIRLPAPYEIYPYSFFNSEVLEKAHHPKRFGIMGTFTFNEFNNQQILTSLTNTRFFRIKRWYWNLHHSRKLFRLVSESRFWWGAQTFLFYGGHWTKYLLYVLQIRISILAKQWGLRFDNRISWWRVSLWTQTTLEPLFLGTFIQWFGICRGLRLGQRIPHWLLPDNDLP